MSTDEILLWVDVETSGLGAHIDHLLQVAALATDMAGNELANPVEWVIRYPANLACVLRTESAEIVQEMHDRTGLWGKLPDGIPRESVDRALLDYVKAVAPERRRARVAGASVRLDLNFLEFHLPRTYAHLDYHFLDVSGTSHALAANGLIPERTKPEPAHTALADLRASLAEYRRILGALQ